MPTEPETFTWLRVFSLEDMKNLHATLNQTTFNTWSHPSHKDKLDRPIIIIGLREQPFGPSRKVLAAIFLGHHGETNRQTTHKMLEDICIERGISGEVMEPKKERAA